MFVHRESKSVKTTILIASHDIAKMSFFVSKLSKVKVGDDEIDRTMCDGVVIKTANEVA